MPLPASVCQAGSRVFPATQPSQPKRLHGSAVRQAFLAEVVPELAGGGSNVAHSVTAISRSGSKVTPPAPGALSGR